MSALPQENVVLQISKTEKCSEEELRNAWLVVYVSITVLHFPLSSFSVC